MQVGQDVLDKLHLTADEFNTLYLTFVSLSVISLILCVFVAITYIVFKNTFPARIILFMSVCVSITHLSDLAILFEGPKLYNDHAACFLQGLVLQFSAVSTVLWWSCITVNLYVSFILGHPPSDFERSMHLICWPFSLLFTIIPAATKSYGVVGLWCWINEPIQQFTFYYLELAVCLITGVFIWGSSISKVLKMRERSLTLSVRNYIPHYVVRQIVFAVWLFFVFAFMFTHRVYDHFTKSKGRFDYQLEVAHVIGLCSQGIFVFLIFGLKREHWDNWRSLFQQAQGKSSRRSSYEPLT